MDTTMGDVSILGTCKEMCPVKERNERELGKRLSIFEIDHTKSEGRKLKTSADICVKEYVRSAAGSNKVLPNELRPADVLLKTVRYLLEEVFIEAKCDRPLVESCHFISDRIRAVRQDMYIQRLKCFRCLKFLSMAVRYHILLPVLLHREKIEHFDPKLNKDLLQLYLSDFLDIFEEQYHNSNTNGIKDQPVFSEKLGISDAKDRSFKVSETSEKKSYDLWIEFEIYNILLNLNSNTSLVHCIHLYNCYQQYRGKLKPILDLCLSYVRNNYYKVLKLSLQLSYLEKCCLLNFYDKIRFDFLNQLNVAYSIPNCRFPVDVLVKWMKFLSTEDCCEFCQLAGVENTGDFLNFSKKLKLSSDDICGYYRKSLCKGLAMLSPPQFYRKLVLGP